MRWLTFTMSIRRLILGCTLLVLIGLVGCGSDKPTAPQPPTLSQRVAGAEQRLAFKLFPVVNQQYPDSNIFYSPLDMMFESAGLLLGARGTGATQIQQGMEVDSLSVYQFIQGMMSLRQTIAASSPSASFHQVLFNCTDYGVYESYMSKCSLSLATEIVRLDCSSPLADATIRDWWNDRSHGYFTDTNSNVIDTTWVYYPWSFFWYDGQWATPFDPASVRPDSFLTSTGERVACSLMTSTGQFPVYQETGFSVVQLPYTDADFGAVFFLPDSGVTISSMIETLTLGKWKSILSHLVTQDVTIHLPKISHQGKSLRIKSSLQQVGITLLFYDIDLSDMVNLPSAALSDWRILGYQRFLPDSMGNMMAKPVMPETPNAVTLTFTRPFYYIVWHKPTGSILYQGKVVRPMLN